MRSRTLAILASAIALAAAISAASAQAPLTAAQERALAPQDRFHECAGCPELVVVPAGSFLMGSPASEQPREANEGPQHAVTIARRFALGRLEVTVDQLAAFVDATGHDMGTSCDVWQDGAWKMREGPTWRKPSFSQTGAHPAPCVSFDDAKAYLAWLSRRTGKIYRLPTEAEWEYAARGGARTRFHFGDSDRDYCRYGNGADQAARKGVPGAAADWDFLRCNDGFAFTAPAGSFAPNPFGLHDMLGNVFEWVEDCWHDSYDGAPADGAAWISGDCGTRVQRGGAWGYPPDYLRTAVRGRQPQSYRYINAGMRVLRELAGEDDGARAPR
jgi:formylglycine-generating enzyme required for sulfatase activity